MTPPKKVETVQDYLQALGAESPWWVLRIDIEPIGKGRPRFSTVSGADGKVASTRVSTPKQTRKWELDVAHIVSAKWRRDGHIRGMGETGDPANPTYAPLELRVYAAKTRPKSLCRKKDPDGLLWRDTVPDTDNVLKIVGDALQQSVVICNDKSIVRWYGESLYAPKGVRGYTEIWLRVATPFPAQRTLDL